MTAPVFPGAEPYRAEGGPAGVLVLHGFTGSPFSVVGVGRALADAGFSVEVPLLAGHGTTLEDMVPTRWADWSKAAEESYAGLAARVERVAVFGLSMGGTLAVWLAAHHPDIAGLVLVNPLIEPAGPPFRDALQQLLDSGTEVAPGIGSDIAKPGVVEEGYDGTPLAAALSLFEGVDEVAAGLDRVRCPVLLLSSRVDHIVAPSSGDLLASSVSGPCERVWLERSLHVATLDYDRELVEARTVAFARTVTG